MKSKLLENILLNYKAKNKIIKKCKTVVWACIARPKGYTAICLCYKEIHIFENNKLKISL